jgi:hypothetical protein
VYLGVVSDDSVKVDDQMGPRGRWVPAGPSHAVVFGTLTTMCGRALLEPFFSFYEHSFAEDGLNRCVICARLAEQWAGLHKR